MSLLWREKAREITLQFFFIKRIRLIFFLWPYRWVFKIYLRVMSAGGSPGFRVGVLIRAVQTFLDLVYLSKEFKKGLAEND